jgi:hypothetical protein
MLIVDCVIIVRSSDEGKLIHLKANSDGAPPLETLAIILTPSACGDIVPLGRRPSPAQAAARRRGKAEGFGPWRCERMKATTAWLSESEMSRIADQAIDVLQRVGMRFAASEVLPLLAERGAVIDEATGIARLPRSSSGQSRSVPGLS